MRCGVDTNKLELIHLMYSKNYTTKWKISITTE